jgi:histidinol phosphatase-like PHP family hydrolase
LTLLVLTDIHYASHADSAETPAAPRYRMGLEFARRALIEAERLCEPDAIVVLGDALAGGDDLSAESDLAAVAATVREACPIVLAVPGNHDGDPERFLRLFGDRPGAHRVKGYDLYTFADRYAADETMTRSSEATEAFLKARSEAPTVAIQHSPIYPDADTSKYPYMPLNRSEIIDSYREREVVLSLSGHYHRGQPPARKDGTLYATLPALVDEPFGFAVVRLSVREAAVEVHRLKHPEFAQLVDGHIHTHFGYCAVDVHPDPVRERLELFGLAGAVFIEHAPQLYLPDVRFWNAEHIERPECIRNARRDGACRLDAFRKAMRTLGNGTLRVGLEAELDRDGNLTLLDEDRQGWDRILGAVHWMPSNLPFDTPARREKSFLKVIEGLAAAGIDVLAHPFRYFSHKRLPRPSELYAPVAEVLCDHGIAAELNFHFNRPDADFFRVCMEKGVRIVVGSDAHNLFEVADLGPHVRLLKEIGALPRGEDHVEATAESDA